MPKGKSFKARVRILVKAFPQPSKRYKETVCCAGVNEETGKLVRLFPIRYRQLTSSAKFDRWDLVELIMSKASDSRPESYHVDEDSIKILERATTSNFSEQQRVAMWAPFVYDSLEALNAAQKGRGTSLGIIRPDNVSFEHVPFDQAENEDRQLLQQQAALFEEPLKPIKPPEYSFRYRFTSAGQDCTRKILDWEVQAAFYKFKRLYGAAAMDKLYEQYATRIPARNLHFVLGTVHQRPWQFILIGLLRSGISPQDAGRQPALF